jgi:hypothetical protein
MPLMQRRVQQRTSIGMLRVHLSSDHHWAPNLRIDQGRNRLTC